MRTLTVRMFVFATGVLLFASERAVAQDSRLVNIGTHSLNCVMVGKGEPTVVIDGGLGSRLDEWKSIIDSLRKFTRVVAYNRAGYGRSEPGPFPRNSRQEAVEMKALLEKIGISSPVVLVGHSLGGANAQYFAYAYPHLTAGLILLEPPPLGWITGTVHFPDLDSMAIRQTRSFLSMERSAASSSDPEAAAAAQFFRTLASEHEEMFKVTSHQVNAIKSFSNVPLTVIASGKPNPALGASAEQFQEFWIAESKALTRKSTRGRFLLVKESSHQIHQDAAPLVLSEIMDMVHSLRHD